MIDIENEVFSKVATPIRLAIKGIFIAGEYIKNPAKFPYMTMEEKDNATAEKYQSSSIIETHATVMYEINVYSNKTAGKKTECKKIIALADEEMQKMGFTRIMKSSVPNLEDATVHRMTTRYKAVVDNNQTIYRK